MNVSQRFYPFHRYLPQYLQAMKFLGYADYDDIIAATHKKLTGQVPLRHGDVLTDHIKFIFIDSIEPDSGIRFLAGTPASPGEMEMLELPLEELFDICIPDGVVELEFVYNALNYNEIKNSHLKALEDAKNSN